MSVFVLKWHFSAFYANRNIPFQSAPRRKPVFPSWRCFKSPFRIYFLKTRWKPEQAKPGGTLAGTQCLRRRPGGPSAPPAPSASRNAADPGPLECGPPRPSARGARALLPPPSAPARSQTSTILPGGSALSRVDWSEPTRAPSNQQALLLNLFPLFPPRPATHLLCDWCVHRSLRAAVCGRGSGAARGARAGPGPGGDEGVTPATSAA